MNHSVKTSIVAFIAGFIFAAGLIVASMNNPNYIQGFLNVGGIFDAEYFGPWYPKLAFVMLSAVSIMFAVFYKTKSKANPILEASFNLPTKTKIDFKLIIGSSLFGIGWGLFGYCPGPAIASLFVANKNVLIFILSMTIGMLIARKIK